MSFGQYGRFGGSAEDWSWSGEQPAFGSVSIGAEAAEPKNIWGKIGDVLGSITDVALKSLGNSAADSIAKQLGSPSESPIVQAQKKEEAQKAVVAAAAARGSGVMATMSKIWPIVAVGGVGLTALGAIIFLKRRK